MPVSLSIQTELFSFRIFYNALKDFFGDFFISLVLDCTFALDYLTTAKLTTNLILGLY